MGLTTAVIVVRGRVDRRRVVEADGGHTSYFMVQLVPEVFLCRSSAGTCGGSGLRTGTSLGFLGLNLHNILSLISFRPFGNVEFYVVTFV